MKTLYVSRGRFISVAALQLRKLETQVQFLMPNQTTQTVLYPSYGGTRILELYL